VFFSFSEMNNYLRAKVNEYLQYFIYTFTFMKKLNQLRRIAPIAVIVALMMATAACTSNKKYGCPNHLQSSFSAR